jgi:hypothetical protein
MHIEREDSRLNRNAIMMLLGQERELEILRYMGLSTSLSLSPCSSSLLIGNFPPNPVKAGAADPCDASRNRIIIGACTKEEWAA